MNSTINFLLESGISLALLSTIYVFFLRKETFFRLNRMFLLLSVVFSVILPFLRFRVYNPQPVMLPEVTVTPYRNLMEVVTIYGQDFSRAVEKTIGSSWIFIWIYLFGLCFFLGKFILRLVQILLLIRKNPVQKNGAIKFVSVKKDFSPFSFLSFVFINPEKSSESGYDKMVAHEMEHIKQGHTFDVLILEILTVFQWFNPFMWILKRAIRENHEYLADHAVLKSGIHPVQYKQLLLNQVVGLQLELANNFNSSLIKKRIKMISKLKSSKLSNLKYVIGIVSVIALAVAFACETKETEVEEKSEQLELKTLPEEAQIFFVVEEMPEFPGGEAALRKYIANYINYPAVARENGISGKVYVTFVVSKDGSIANAKIAGG